MERVIMDLVAYALAKNYTDRAIAGAGAIKGEKGDDGLTPYIGENGNWFIGDVDTGVSASPKELIEVDGKLVADTDNNCLYVEKDGQKTIVGECSSAIATDNIKNLFKEG